MRGAALFGPLIVIVGLVLGAVMAVGMSMVEASTRAQNAPPALGAAVPPAMVAVKSGAGDATKGRTPYEHACGGCHGPTGNGDTPLRGPLLNAYYPRDEMLAGILRNGIGTMPGYSQDEIPDQQMADIIAFMRALR
ncbi:MAG: cytochrome c [Anaerolineae bacterium]